MLSVGEIEARLNTSETMMDAHYPPNWRSRLNLDTLDVSDDRRCPVAQLDKSGTWEHGYQALLARGVSFDQLAGLYVEPAATSRFDYRRLTTAWKKRIREQLAVRTNQDELVDA